VKEYTRDETAPFEATSLSPMNRIVDAVSLESDTARRFSGLVDKFLASNCRDAALAAELRATLTRWSQNDAAFAPLAQKSSLAKEGAATSRDLSAIGNVGLAALDAIAAAKPKVQLLLVPVASIQKLVASASQPTFCTNK